MVISSTESPHYTITAGKAAELLKDGRERLFIDIAVPADIDREISALPGCRLIAIDDFRNWQAGITCASSRRLRMPENL